MDAQITCLTPDNFQKYLQHNSCFCSYYNTAIGTLTVLSTQQGIYKVFLDNNTPNTSHKFLPTIPYAKFLLVGTPFQQKVWQATLEISRGSTISYQGLAQKIGYPKAIRAVANALAANQIPYFIPCHRIIRSSGQLGGYALGIENKKILLQAELQHTHLLFV